MSKADSQNLSLFEFIMLMAALTAIPALSTDIVLPALGILPRELSGATIENTSLAVSIFFAGMGAGQLIFGPLCDGIGRRASIFLGLLIFVAGTLVCILTRSFEFFLLGRFLQALGASGPRIASMAIVRDKYEGNEMARVFSFIISVFILVPMLAPLVGQSIIHVANWHWIFIMLLIFAAGSATWFHFRQGETLNPEKRSSLRPREILQDMLKILSIKSVLGYTLSTGAAFGVMVTYVSSAQHVFQNLYSTGDKFPLYFAVLALSVGLASFLNGNLVRKFGMFQLVLAAMGLNLACSIVLLLLSLSSNGLPSLVVFSLLSFVINFGNGVLLGNITALAMQPLANSAGFGAALISSLSTFISVPIAIVIGKYIQHSLTPYATGFMLSCCAAILFTYWAYTQSRRETQLG